jgi:hypothetical protein
VVSPVRKPGESGASVSTAAWLQRLPSNSRFGAGARRAARLGHEVQAEGRGFRPQQAERIGARRRNANC